ncbi:conserved hypothetical protein [Ricinus communis]|uniref:Uncharacterized protein n=1 Tax=Ricinus communis TaxID=3988 RepID=B9RTN0_RICCO|nr:conserved hypothetical protein [Ricinus communis]EEF45262.1 conserved hypothetical protein [Ricinus communis]
MANNKVAALLVMCLVLVAAVELLPQAGADKFASCFNNCEQECKASGQGQTFCEMKCDTDCFNKDVAGNLSPMNL